MASRYQEVQGPPLCASGAAQTAPLAYYELTCDWHTHKAPLGALY